MNLRIYRSGELISETEAKTGETLLQGIRDAGVFIHAPCGGEGRCGKCKVSIKPGAHTVLACREIIKSGIRIDIAAADDLQVQVYDDQIPAIRHPNAQPRSLGVAVDIGTTTIGLHLINLETGQRIASGVSVNAQAAYGADVISRIKYCKDNGHEGLTKLVREQLAACIREICGKACADYRRIEYIVIAANTIMQHLAAGYSPVGMGSAPFDALSLFGDESPAWEGFPASNDAMIYYAPAVSAYIGGDITSGLLAATGERSGTVLFIDKGTNGEIVLIKDGICYCCAAAAGPAFEGAEITMGMAAVTGAINHMKWDREHSMLNLSTVGDAPPVGLCGSGLLDALALMLETGALDETGRLLNADEINHPIASHMHSLDGMSIFCVRYHESLCAKTQAPLTDPYPLPVYITARDIRRLQLAKAAIAAGIQTLMEYAGISEMDIDELILAGGFGSFLDVNSAAEVGLFPKSLLRVAKTIGNAAGEGAAIALCSETARRRLEDIRSRCEYIELSANQTFNDKFIEHMIFEAHD